MTEIFQHTLDDELVQFDHKLDQRTARLLVDHRLTVSVAESMTAGLLGNRLTRIAGSSSYFLGGVIAYSSLLKVNLLGVPADLIRTQGAVSSAVCEAMAMGVQRLTKSTVAVAITGHAGPASLDVSEAGVGLVYIGVWMADRVTVKSYQCEGSRETIQQIAATAAVSMVNQTVKSTIKER